MIQLNAQQQDRFDRLFPDLQRLPTEQRRTELAKIAKSDPDVAAVLEFALKEPPSLRSLAPGDLVGDCTLIERLSAGSYGEVWKAQQGLAGGSTRLVAIKFIHPHLLLDDPAKAQHYLQLFHQEIEALAQFQHPHIVRILQTIDLPSRFGDLEVPCVVMEYHESHPLHPTPYLPDRAARLGCFLKVCDAVHCSHNHGRVHLDLKPDNIRVRPDGEPIVIDFGISERLRPEQPVMPWLIGIGTLPYMAPEQLDGQHPIGKATDVHALGVLLFQMLTDRLPYDLRESTEEEFRRLICEADRLSLLACRAGEDHELAGILAKAMSRDPAERFADAGELRDTLAAWRQTPITVGLAAPALRRYREWVVRQNALLDLGDLGSAADAGRSGGRLKLARVYVELDTTSLDEPERRSETKGREMLSSRDLEKAEKLTAVGALLKHRRLALLGLPGAGKSTFIRNLSLHLAAHPLPPNQGVLEELKLKGEDLPPIPDWPAADAEMVPITVVLRRFAAECAPKAAPPDNAGSGARPQPKAAHACHLWDFIQSNLREENLDDAARPLREALETGRAIVFFDGLDEVPDDEQKQFVCEAVRQFAESVFAPSRMVLTCRTFSYRNQDWRVPGFNEVELAEFDDEKIQRFIPAWFEALAEEGVLTAEQARHKGSTLWPAIRERGLRELAGNPLQLTNMAVLHRVETLPDNRALLYDRLVRLLLLQWDKVRFDKDKVAVPLHALREEAECREDEFVDGLAWLAWQVHDPKHGGQPGQPADISEMELRGALERLHPSQDDSTAGRCRKADWALRVVQVFRQRGALLREEGRGMFKFPHRSYQEFLAGTHLAQQPDFVKEAAALVDDSRHWWEVVRWAANYMAYVKRSTHLSLGLAAELCADAQQDHLSPLAWRKVYLAGDILAEIGVSQVRRCRGVGDERLTQARQLLARLIELGDDALPARERAAAGITLGKLEDPRRGVALGGDGLPDIGWIEIPAGDFPMGNDKPEVVWGTETPRFNCTLIRQMYSISRYPITVAQYQAFVDAGGYADTAKDWWTEAGWEWKQSEKRAGPDNYDTVYQTPNHPRVGVTWFEAVAFCRWLSVQLEQNVMLPSEAQWERAARHTDARTFPWGNQEECPQRCNMAETGIGHTSAVGMFPSGKAECGAMDMAGNVWEWCRTKWTNDYKDYERREKELNEPDGSDSRVLRGGSFGGVRVILRCAFRDRGVAPVGRGGGVGFRVVVVAGGSAC